ETVGLKGGTMSALSHVSGSTGFVTARRTCSNKRAMSQSWALGCARLAAVLFAGCVTVTCGALLVDMACAHLSASPQEQGSKPPAPVEPTTAILDAFRTHDIVALSDPHGNVQMQAFILSLIRDGRFPLEVNDIVIETASARYQDAVDRFVRGDDVPYDVLRKAWQDHTVANSLGQQAEEMIRAVRTLNASLSPGTKLRVIAGDPPIDWDNITAPEDHRRWIELRDSYPADVIRRQVLDRGRHALVIYGQGHLQRRQIASNYDMSTWQSQTVVSLLEHDSPARILNIWTLLDKDVIVPETPSWPVPSLVALPSTTLGARDFGTYSRGLGSGARVTVRSGQLVPLPPAEWKMMRMEDEFDALLYLGPPSSMTNVTIPAALCHDSQFVNTRLQRLTRFGPPIEVERFKKACGM
ncbi:MAG: hypothetical protein ACRD3J_27620, partial [Thermoanaerobaculia bacterium]